MVQIKKIKKGMISPVFIFFSAALFAAAVYLITQARSQVSASQEREARMAFLYSLIREIAVSVKLENAFQVIAKRIGEMFHCNLILFVSENSLLFQKAEYPSQIKMSESDYAKAVWAFQNNKPAGCHTNFFSGSEWFFSPLEVEGHPVGILSLNLQANDGIISSQQDGFLDATASQLGIVIERASHLKVIEQARLLNEARKLETTLLSCISHDFRTPISSILGASAALLDEEARYDLASQKELLFTIQEEAERLNRFVSNLLDMMKLQSGLKLNQEWVEFQDLLGSSLSRLSNLLSDRHLVVALEPNLPMLFLDFVLFEHVLLNLLDNAVKYSEPGTTIWIKAYKKEERIFVEITDEGVGIPLLEQRSVFQKFYRIKETARPNAGTGLGLSICKGIVEAHGGKISAKSLSSGKGVSMVIELPAGTEISYSLEKEKQYA